MYNISGPKSRFLKHIVYKPAAYIMEGGLFPPHLTTSGDGVKAAG